MSQSAGGDAIHMFSPGVVARAVAIPVGALKTDDLMGEAPRVKKLGYAVPSKQTPDLKAEDIAKKALGTNPESTLHDIRQKL